MKTTKLLKTAHSYGVNMPRSGMMAQAGCKQTLRSIVLRRCNDDRRVTVVSFWTWSSLAIAAAWSLQHQDTITIIYFILFTTKLASSYQLTSNMMHYPSLLILYKHNTNGTNLLNHVDRFWWTKEVNQQYDSSLHKFTQKNSTIKQWWLLTAVLSIPVQTVFKKMHLWSDYMCSVCQSEQ